MTTAAYVPRSGDLIWTDFDPTRGREQAGRRPALVVSASTFTENTGLAVVCPITSRIRPFPTSVVLPAGRRNAVAHAATMSPSSGLLFGTDTERAAATRLSSEAATVIGRILRLKQTRREAP